MDLRRAESLVDLHAELRKEAFARALPRASAFFDDARRAFVATDKVAAVQHFDRALRVHLTTP